MFFSGSKEYDVPFDINLRDVNGQTVLYLACCVGNLKIVELLLKYQVKARKVSGKTATLKKKKTGSKDDQSKPSMVATRTSFQTVPTPQQSSIQVSLFFRQIDCFKKKTNKEMKKRNRKFREYKSQIKCSFYWVTMMESKCGKNISTQKPSLCDSYTTCLFSTVW